MSRRVTSSGIQEALASYYLPFTDLTSNQFIDGMKKIFELEPFINIYSISANREGGEFPGSGSSKSIKDSSALIYYLLIRSRTSRYTTSSPKNGQQTENNLNNTQSKYLFYSQIGKLSIRHLLYLVGAKTKDCKRRTGCCPYPLIVLERGV